MSLKLEVKSTKSTYICKDIELRHFDPHYDVVNFLLSQFCSHQENIQCSYGEKEKL